MTSIILTLSSAFALEGYDAHGFMLVPGAGDTQDALGVYSATANVPESFSVQVLGEYAQRPFGLQHEDGTYEGVVDDLFAVNLGARYAIGERLAVTAAMPIYLSSTGQGGSQGLASGDLRLSAPINLLQRSAESFDVGLAVVPVLTLPTGAAERMLGDEGMGAGALGVVTVGGERWSLSVNGGLNRRSETNEELSDLHLDGGMALVGGVGLAVDLVKDRLAIVGEVKASTPAVDRAYAWSESPAEATLSLRYKTESGIGVTAGVARGLGPRLESGGTAKGASAAEHRVFLGVSYSGKVKDAAPAPKAVADADLCVTVVDPDGMPIHGAVVQLDGDLRRVDSDDPACFIHLQPGQELVLDASARTYSPARDKVRLNEGANYRTLTLDPHGAQLKVIAIDELGSPVPARVRFLAGPEDHEMSGLGADGENTFDLEPGTWRVLVADEAHVPEDRTVTLDRGEFETLVVRFTDEQPIAVCSGPVDLHNVHFDFDIDVPRPDAMPVLSSVARQLMDCPDVTVEVGGHTDWIGEDIYNVDLSQRRMDSVKRILVGYGVPAERLVPIGYGERQPIAPNTTDAGRALNRRVSFTQIEQVSSAETEGPSGTR